MKKPSESASELKALIKRAIADCEITPAEYDAIMQQAHDDGKIDPEEQALLSPVPADAWETVPLSTSGVRTPAILSSSALP